MSSLADHCAECKRVLGKEYREVHEWLDELFKYMPGDVGHRFVRHHKDGVKKVRERWGNEAAKAAEIHIHMDYPGLGKIPDIEDYEHFKDWSEYCDFMQDGKPEIKL